MTATEIHTIGVISLLAIAATGMIVALMDRNLITRAERGVFRPFGTILDAIRLDRLKRLRKWRDDCAGGNQAIWDLRELELARISGRWDEIHSFTLKGEKEVFLSVYKGGGVTQFRAVKLIYKHLSRKYRNKKTQ